MPGLTRQSTAVGKKRGGARMRAATKKGYKRKVTARGAYKRPQKRQAYRSRKPFVEGKRRIASDISRIMTSNQTVATGFYKQPLLDTQIVINPTITGGGNAFQNIPITVFNRMNQGFNDFEMIGTSIFSRFLKIKVRVDFPIGSDVLVKPFKMYLVSGWVTNPLNKNAHTLIHEADVTQTILNQHVETNLLEYFDDKNDTLEFHKKTRQNIKVESYRRILPKTAESVFGQRTHVEQVAPGSSSKTAAGAPPYVQLNHSWKVMRKVHYTLGLSESDGNTLPQAGDTELQNYYVNDGWIPFSCFYMPDWDQMVPVNSTVPTEQLTFRHNIYHNYSDS